jgi:hypothetical protein
MRRQKRVPRGARIFGYTIALVVNFVIWYIIHNLGRWNLLYIVAEEFTRVLPAFDLSLAATMVLNALWVAYDPRWFRHLGQAVLNALSLNVMYMLYRVFPFRFPGNLDQWARGALLLGMVAVGIATVVEFFRLFSPTEE